jgi:hypothetical protein
MIQFACNPIPKEKSYYLLSDPFRFTWKITFPRKIRRS